MILLSYFFRTDNKQTFELILKLCKKYDVPVQDVVINYLSHVILHCDDLSFNYCNSVITDADLLKILCGDSNEHVAEW